MSLDYAARDGRQRTPVATLVALLSGALANGCLGAAFLLVLRPGGTPSPDMAMFLEQLVAPLSLCFGVVALPMSALAWLRRPVRREAFAAALALLYWIAFAWAVVTESL